MATGRSGELVIYGSKDRHSSPSRGKRRPHPTEAAYFLQRRFEDTALVVFQQHVRRLKEVSPGHYTPLPSSTLTPLSRFQIPGLDLSDDEGQRTLAQRGSEKAGSAVGAHKVSEGSTVFSEKVSGGSAKSTDTVCGGSASAHSGWDQVSTSSAASSSVRLVDSVSPDSSFSSAAKAASFRNCSGSASFPAYATPESGSGLPFEGNGDFSQGLHAQYTLSLAADGSIISFSDDSSVTSSSAPDSNFLEEEGGLSGPGVEPVLQAWTVVAEERLHREQYFAGTVNGPVGVPHINQVVARKAGPVSCRVPAQQQSHRVNGSSPSQSKSGGHSSSLREPPVEPASLKGLGKSRFEGRFLAEGQTGCLPREQEQYCLRGDEEVQITRL